MAANARSGIVMPGAGLVSRHHREKARRAGAGRDPGARRGGTVSCEARYFPNVEVDNFTCPETTKVRVKQGLEYDGSLLVAAEVLLSSSGLSLHSQDVDDEEDARTFHITDAETGGKVTRMERLQEVRNLFVRNILTTLGVGETVEEPVSTRIEELAPTTVVRVVPALVADSPTVLYIETRDRPEVLYNVNRILKGLNVKVVSTNVHNVGEVAQLTLYTKYRGGPLPSGIKEMVINSLQFYLTLPEFNDENSY